MCRRTLYNRALIACEDNNHGSGKLALKAITHGTIGIAFITLLLVLLIGLRKELNGGEPLRGTVDLGFVVLGLCAFMALMAALYSARKVVVLEKISNRLDTAECDVPVWRAR